MRFRQTLIVALFAMAAAAPSWSATYYVAARDAVANNSTADGSKTRPWPTVNLALTRVKAGDTILLMDGPHYGLKVDDLAFATPVTIRSLNAKKARLSWILLQGDTRNLVFQNLSVWPADPSNASTRKLIETGYDATDIVFDGLDVRSGSDAASYPGWTKAQWEGRSFNGFYARGARTTIKNSTFTGIGPGVQTVGADSRILNNTVAGFSNDGMRVFGNGSIVRGNKVTDCVRIDGNHPDALQSWSVDGKPVDGLLIENNTFLEWSNAKINPYRCQLQGVGFFDGFYDNLVIRNNVLSLTAYHGISVYGGRNVSIVNNTVVNAKGAPAGYPWIAVFSHKNGTPSRNVVTANNLAMKFSSTAATVNTTTANNSVIIYPAKVLTDVAKFNYRPKADSGFIDTGNAVVAPKGDILNNLRPSGKGPDRGAYEVGSTSAAATTVTTTTATTQTAGKWVSAP